MVQILKFIFGNTLKTIISRSGIIVACGILLVLKLNYNNAIKDATRYKNERDKVVVENIEYIGQIALLMAQKDSLNQVIKKDNQMYKSLEEQRQSLIAQQRNIIKDKDKLINEKDKLISDMTKNLKVLNWRGKIVDRP